MNTKIQAVALAAFSVVASASAGIVTDATFDLFDNGLSNLDITQVNVSDDGVNLSIAVTTRGFQNWTKYMLYFDTAAGGTSTNGWGRPVNLTSNIEHYIGSWVDAPSSNVQFWSWSSSWSQTGTLSNSVSGNTVTFTLSLASLGLSAGSTMYFDVATSGGGNDPGVDHLSRSDAATPGWETASTSGNFIAYTVTPAPGALALLGVAGIVGARRRR